jgi:hypothetical protein
MKFVFNKYLLIIHFLLACGLSFAQDCDYLSNHGVTVLSQDEEEGTYTVISFDKWRIVTSDSGGLAVHDKSPYEATIAVSSKNIGIYYALLDDSGKIVGEVSDVDQDGLPDLKIFINGKVEVYIEGKWRSKQKDNNGHFIMLNNKKVYLVVEPQFGKFVVN